MTAVSTIVPARVTAQGIDIGAIVTAVNTLVPANVTAYSTSFGLVFTVAGQVDANIQYVNDVAVTGTGAAGNEWGP